MIRNRNSVQGQSLIARKIDLPGTPTVGTATNIASSLYNNGSATVAFTASAFGGPAASFTATSSPGGFTGTSTSSPITVSGLQSNTNYTFTVAGVNSSGTGAQSGASNQITAVTTPQAPTVGTATIVSTSQVSLTFTAPANNGGSAITGYSVVSSPSVALTVSSGTSSPVTVTGTFNASQAYTFTIAAINAGGTGAFSAASNSIIPRPGITATGGTITTSGGYKYHTFTSNGTFTVTANPGPFEYLAIAGGGSAENWGGGGAGGLLQQTYSTVATSDAFAITIGAGGTTTKGSDTTIIKNGSTTVVTCFGGGLGAANDSRMNGGSGAGAGYSNSVGVGTAGPPRQGYDGNNAPGGYYNGGGGGGGAGSNGGAGSTSFNGNRGGSGGDGAAYSVWATATSTGVGGYYAGGGGGAIWGDGGNQGSSGLPGSGGGGRGEFNTSGGAPAVAPTSGTANTGGGAGAKFTGSQQAGGSGIVIVRYPG